MTPNIRLVLLTLSVSAAVPAHASDKRDFAACDGRNQPGKAEDGMSGMAPVDPYGSYRTELSNNIDACTRALASPKLLPTQILRRAHLLRARAATHLRSNEPQKAIADLDAAESATAKFADERFFRRSMAVSFLLLRATAHLQANEPEKAAALAQTAIERRPYSLQVRTAAARIMQVTRPFGIASPSPWLPVKRLDPDIAVSALSNEASIGNYAAVVGLRPQTATSWPTAPLPAFALNGRSAEAAKYIVSMDVGFDTAYARAATGDPTGARKDLAELTAKLASLKPQPATGALAQMNDSGASALDRFIASRARQVEARIAVAEGRDSDAIGMLVASNLMRDAATIELLSALKSRLPQKDAGLLPDIKPFRDEFERERRDDIGKTASLTLVAPETPRNVIDYDKARPNILGALIGGGLSLGTSLLGGIKRGDGFRTTPNADGTSKVEFVGNTPSASLVQEMTLLRAAEVAREAGKPAFVIVDRSDYSRTMTTSRGGVTISSVPAGYKTELTIRLVGEGEKASDAIDAVAIIDALGPYYYDKAETAK